MVLKNRTLWLSLFVLVACAAAWLGWRWYDERYPTWEEEVQLSDGRVIVVRQKHEYYDNYGTAQSWVTFSLPEIGGERTWHSYLKPMRIDVYQGSVYAFGRPRGDRQVQHYQYPRNYMVAFTWTGTDFQRIPFLNVPEALRFEENVFPCVPALRSSMITWTQKDKTWCPPSGARGELTRTIDLRAYQELANTYARRDGGVPRSE